MHSEWLNALVSKSFTDQVNTQVNFKQEIITSKTN